MILQISSFLRVFLAIPLSEIKDILSLICSTITICCAIYAFYRFNKNKWKEREEKKIDRFRKKIQYADKMKSESTRQRFTYYLNKYNNELSSTETSGLIISKKWELKSDRFIKLNEIVIDDVTNNHKGYNILDLNNPINPTYIQLKKELDNLFPLSKQGYTTNFINYGNKDNYLFNGNLYAACDIKVLKKDDNKKMIISVYQTNYFNFLDTCKVLEYKYDFGKQVLTPEYDVLDFSNRHAGIGVNCLTIFPNITNADGKKKDYFILHSRGAKVMESPGSIHVVPAGSYQPIYSIQNMNNSIVEDFNKDLSNTIYREFCEEILHTEHMRELVSAEFLVNHDDYKDLIKNSNIYFLNVGLEPYNTKVEVDCFMVYQNPEISRFNQLENFLNLKEEDKSICNEGKIIIEEFNKQTLEQYWASNNVTPSAKEIFKRTYEYYDKIKDLFVSNKK